MRLGGEGWGQGNLALAHAGTECLSHSEAGAILTLHLREGTPCRHTNLLSHSVQSGPILQPAREALVLEVSLTAPSLEPWRATEGASQCPQEGRGPRWDPWQVPEQKLLFLHRRAGRRTCTAQGDPVPGAIDGHRLDPLI